MDREATPASFTPQATTPSPYQGAGRKKEVREERREAGVEGGRRLCSAAFLGGTKRATNTCMQSKDIRQEATLVEFWN